MRIRRFPSIRSGSARSLLDQISALRNALADRYQIERELGHGGMATVYLARDLRHDREVALKLLRPELAAVLGRDRFLTEIRLTARLDHPHILTLIDSGESDGFLWCVLPYVRGDNLRARLDRDRQLGVDEALAIARDIAGALAYAHQRGVIHRDIKPENILFHEGEAMLADFGIALAVKESGGSRLTETGLSLGTPQYMSPEQATGDRQLDARSDVYSLGAVVYEMLAGEPPVTGPTVQAMSPKLMTERPTRLQVVRDTVSPGVDAAVMKALAKVPSDRFPGTAEFTEALARAAGPEITAPVRSHRPLLIAGIASGLVQAAVADQRQITFTGDAFNAAISPDGNWLTYISGDTALMVQEVAGGRAIPVLHGVNFRQPVWSPDGGTIMAAATLNGDLARDATWEVPRLGGEPKRVGGNGYSYDYSPDGAKLVWVVFDTLGITSRENGTELRRVALPGISTATLVRWSPDGRRIAIIGTQAKVGRAVFLMDVNGSVPRLLSPEWTNVPASGIAWNGTGTALYLLGGSRIIRQEIDPSSGAASGSGQIVVAGLNDAFQLSLSRDANTAVVTRGHANTQAVAITVPPGGNVASSIVRTVTSGTGFVGSPAVSPDGRWMKWSEAAGPVTSVLLAPFAGGPPQAVAQYSAGRVLPSRWSPDSRRVAYLTGDSNRSDLHMAGIDGSAPVLLTTIHSSRPSGRPSWTWGAQGLIVPDSADGAYLLIDPVTRSARGLVAGDSIARLYGPVLSPDGRIVLAVRWRPWGFANDLWQHAVGTGAWTPVSYAGSAGATLDRWDASGIYAAMKPVDAPDRPQEIWRSRAPGAPFVPVLRGLSWCTGSPPSFSTDLRHLACIQATFTADVWTIKGLDAETR